MARSTFIAMITVSVFQFLLGAFSRTTHCNNKLLDFELDNFVVSFYYLYYLFFLFGFAEKNVSIYQETDCTSVLIDKIQ